MAIRNETFENPAAFFETAIQFLVANPIAKAYWADAPPNIGIVCFFTMDNGAEEAINLEIPVELVHASDVHAPFFKNHASRERLLEALKREAKTRRERLEQAQRLERRSAWERLDDLDYLDEDDPPSVVPA